MLIAHASDLTGDDTAAFLHAVALTPDDSRLVTIHAGPERSALPSASELAARWGRRIQHALHRVDLEDDVPDSVLGPLRQLRPDLVVVGTHARHGLAALLQGSVGEAIARNLDMPVLVVPNQARGFVNPDSGVMELRKIVIPAGSAEDARRGVAAAHRFAHSARSSPELEVVHAGRLGPELEGLGLAITWLDGSLVDAVVRGPGVGEGCLIVMATRGHDAVGDVLLGSHTERVIRESSCPVLSVPI